MIFLASVSSGIYTMWLNREKRRAWTIADIGCGCLVDCIASVWVMTVIVFRSLNSTNKTQNRMLFNNTLRLPVMLLY